MEFSRLWRRGGVCSYPETNALGGARPVLFQCSGCGQNSTFMSERVRELIPIAGLLPFWNDSCAINSQVCSVFETVCSMARKHTTTERQRFPDCRVGT